jgi:ACS family hexuronate transporter-like MFS transporter
MTPKRMTWIVGALLFLATAVNYLDRLALPIVSPLLRKEFALSEQDYGQIVALFMIAYAIMYAGSGYLVDRFGTKRGFAIFISFWSAAAMLHALATGKWSLAACRFLLGLGEPGNWPAAARAVNEWFEPRFRALGVGVFNAGSSLGSAFAPPVIAFLTIAFGWRAAFLFTGGAGFVWLAAWLAIYRTPQHVYAPRDQRPRADWRVVLRDPATFPLILVRFLTDPVIYFVIFWLPEYLHKERGFDTAMVGRYAWAPYFCGAVAYFFSGWLSGHLIGRGWTMARSRKSGMLWGACFLPVAIAAPLVPNAGLAIACVCFVTVGHAFWIANLQALPADLFPAGEVGTVSGFTGSGGAIGGAIASLGTGWLVQHFSYTPVFLMAGLMHPISAGLTYALLPDRRFNSPSSENCRPQLDG